MAAIRKNKQPPLTPPPNRTIIGTKHAQPPRFKATGRGYFNKLPRFPADAKIANGVLINRAVHPNDKHHMLYLFVDATETGWQLSGETTQAQLSRTFYPRNMSQMPLTIQGTVANQYEYDRIATFVDKHHLSQFNALYPVAATLDGNGNYPAVAFRLFRPQAGAALDTHKPLHYDVVIEDFQAGHQRFMNFPTYQLSCKVVYDHLTGDETVEQAIDYWTTVKDVYGDVLPPVMTTKGHDPKHKKRKPHHPHTSPGANS